MLSARHGRRYAMPSSRQSRQARSMKSRSNIGISSSSRCSFLRMRYVLRVFTRHCLAVWKSPNPYQHAPHAGLASQQIHRETLRSDTLVNRNLLMKFETHDSVMSEVNGISVWYTMHHKNRLHARQESQHWTRVFAPSRRCFQRHRSAG